MQAPLTDKNDIKIFILYLMESLHRPLDFTTVSEISVQDEFVNYFDFAECFAELIDNGSIREITVDKDALYEITENGKLVASELKSGILNIIREKSLRSALRLLSFKSRGSKISCDYSELAKEKYLMSCEISERDEPIMKLSIGVDSKGLLDRMMYNFNEKPEVLYKGIIAILTGEIDFLLD